MDPWGKVILDMDEKSPDVQVVEIDLDYVNEIRTNMPVINSYRDDLYTLVPSVRSNFKVCFLSFNNSSFF